MNKMKMCLSILLTALLFISALPIAFAAEHTSDVVSDYYYLISIRAFFVELAPQYVAASNHRSVTVQGVTENGSTVTKDYTGNSVEVVHAKDAKNQDVLFSVVFFEDTNASVDTITFAENSFVDLNGNGSPAFTLEATQVGLCNFEVSSYSEFLDRTISSGNAVFDFCLGDEVEIACHSPLPLSVSFDGKEIEKLPGGVSDKTVYITPDALGKHTVAIYFGARLMFEDSFNVVKKSTLYSQNLRDAAEGALTAPLSVIMAPLYLLIPGLGVLFAAAAPFAPISAIGDFFKALFKFIDLF